MKTVENYFSMSIAIAGGLLLSCTSAVAVDLNTDSALVVWYKLNDGSGTTAANSAPGGGHNGTLNGGPPTWIAGALGGALDFAPGTSDRVVTSDAAALTPGAITISVWFNADAWSANFMALASKYDDVPYYGWALRRPDSNAIQVFTFSNAYGIVADAFTDTTKWHHAAFTYGGSGDSTVKLYLDGVAVGTPATDPTANMPDTTRNLWIGGDVFSSTGRYFDGQIDDFRMYSRALLPEEIKLLAVPVAPLGRQRSLQLQTRYVQ